MIKLNIGYDYGISDIEWINDFEKNIIFLFQNHIVI